MTKKHWFMVAGVLACIVCVPLIVLALLPPRPGVTKENFDRIEPGMTSGEVEAIFGGPCNEDVCLKGAERPMMAWRSGKGQTAYISFDFDKRVSDTSWDDLEIRGSILQKLRRWLHL